MNRLGTAFFAAAEAVVAVAVGLGLALVPFVLLWGFEYGLQVPFIVFWRGASDVWLIGHGIDVTFVLDGAIAKASGVPGAGAPIIVTIAALGFAILTAWLGGRAGRRFAETDHRVVGIVASVAVVAMLSLGIALGSISVASRPSLWQSVLLPSLWYGVPAIVMAEITRRRRDLSPDPLTDRALTLVARIPSLWRQVLGIGLRGGTAAAAAVTAVAGILVALAMLGSYASVITLYERSHAGVIGGVAMTMGQIAFVPNFVGWAMAWILGPGFAVGAGSSVSPIGTALGPIPAVPVLGALPHGGHTFGLLWILVPVVAGFATATVLRTRHAGAFGPAVGLIERTAMGAIIGVTGGALIGGAVLLSAGSVGPGRLQVVGASALPVFGLAALEIGVPAIAAMLASGISQGSFEFDGVAGSIGEKLRRGADAARARLDAARQAASTRDDPSTRDDWVAPVRDPEPETGSGTGRDDDRAGGGDDADGGRTVFPWHTEEFVAAHAAPSAHAVDRASGDAVLHEADGAADAGWSSAAEEAAADDLPWWRQPRDDH